MFKVFGKKDKRIAELEKENKKLQEEKDGALMLYNTTIKNHEQLEHEYRSLKAGSDGLKAVMESKNKMVRELKDRLRAEEWEHMETLKDLDKLEKENEYMKNRLESIERVFKDIDGEFIKDFREARGIALKRSNKRIRNKQLNKMAVSMEKLLKEVGIDAKRGYGVGR